MNRIEKKFSELKKKRKKAFIAFLTAGDPSLKVTGDLVVGLEKAGVDLIELGVPFSDPLADGPTIQAASHRALKKQTNLKKILALVERLRKKTGIPVALMTYYNPVHHFGEAKFVKEAAKAGVDGLIIPDLPPEEAKALIALSRKSKLSTIFFISPTTTRNRMKTIVKASSGFIYYVSLTGVTGARNKIPVSFIKQVRIVKTLTRKPVCVGFGISTAQQVKKVASIADGVIVGSAIVKKVHQLKDNPHLVLKTSRFVKSLTKVL